MEEIKKNVGRPLLFSNKEELEKKIDAYFESCMEEKWFDEDARDEEGNKLKDGKGNNLKTHKLKKVFVKPATITGLALFLNTSRETLREYKERPEFVDSIKKALDFCHNFIEEGLVNGKINPAAGIFNLKNNYGWHDKTEVENNITVDKVEGFNFVSKKSDETNDRADA